MKVNPKAIKGPKSNNKKMYIWQKEIYMGGVAENIRGDPCGTDVAPPPPPNPDPWVRGHPFGDFISSSSLVRGPTFLNPLVVAPFSLLQISTGGSFRTTFGKLQPSLFHPCPEDVCKNHGQNAKIEENLYDFNVFG